MTVESKPLKGRKSLPNLGQRMTERRVDPIAFADRVDLDPLYLGALISGEEKASPEEVYRLANALACYPEDLTGERGGLYYQHLRSPDNDPPWGWGSRSNTPGGTARTELSNRLDPEDLYWTMEDRRISRSEFLG